MYRIKRVVRSTISCFLAAAIICGIIPPVFPPKTVLADTGTVLAWSGDWHHYCIDGSGYALNTASTKNDKYMRVDTKEGLNSEERAILFWAMLSFMASYRHDGIAAGKIAVINQGAQAAGLKPIGMGVSEADLKAVIHSSKVRARYDWLDYAAAHGEEYLRLAGFLNGGVQSTDSGKSIPALLQEATSLEKAAVAASEEGEYILDFDPSGKDSDFLQQVPIQLSADGVHWSAGTINGWNIQKSNTQVRLTNPDPQAQPVYLKFDPTGTDYAVSSGEFHSPDECYSSTLQVWKCVECAGTHATGGKVHPLENHQRTIWMELEDMPGGAFYAVLGKLEGKGDAGGEIHFQIYRHEEDMDADYLVQLYKYDFETGAPLQGAVFDLYERFDDKDRINQGDSGCGEIYESGMKHTPVLWDGFRLVTSVRTDSEGYASYRMEKEYHYDKTFCDGHPAPLFGSGSESGGEENDNDSEEAYMEDYGDIEDEGEIEGDASDLGNAELAREWLDCVAACEAKAEDGTHFHWIMEEVDADAIEAIASSGEAASCGPAESADSDRAYEESGCKADCEDTYKAFVSMRYSYTFVEKAAREGYVLHGLHADDIPIEIITTDASQNGANGVFGGGYSDDIEGHNLHTQPLAAMKNESTQYIEDDLGNDIHYYEDRIQTQQAGPIGKDLIEYEIFSEQDENLCGSPSNAFKTDIEETASSSNALRGLRASSFSFSRMVNFDMKEDVMEGDNESQLFEDAHKQALNSASKGEEVEKGPSDLYSHGGGADGDEEAWKIYDHRTEGEIHINKRDLALFNQEKKGYSSYGDTQGDAVLEGAVYGLFAADDLVHPDGVTGIVYRQNDLVSIAATDKEGDASFMVITEAPGHTYDYKTGSVVLTEEGWELKAPENLYVKTQIMDDYKADGEYVRSYIDYETENGNCWIGRPLFLGNYYVKELSRSEGYELSVNGQKDPVSNRGYSLEVTIPRGEGTVAVTRAPYVELQSSGEEEDTMPNVINFAVTSQGTGSNGYDIALNLFPKGSRLYRKDSSQTEQKVPTVTGQKEKRYLFDAWGQPIYQRADADNTYPKYNPDGSLMMEKTAVNAVVSSMGTVTMKNLDEEIAEEILENSSDGEDDWERNRKPLILDSIQGPQFLYVKMKIEEVLRACGYETPEKRDRNFTEGGTEETVRYSGREEGIYNEGKHKGEEADKTVYGHPVITVEIPKIKQNGDKITVGDAILSLLDFYGENPWYSYGGLHGYNETDHSWQFCLYAGVTGSPADFVVSGETEEDRIIYHRIPWIPDDREESPRWIYVKYGSELSGDVFGTFRDFKSWLTLGQYRCSAVLVSDAEALGDGTIQSKTVDRNVYYAKGEMLQDSDGSPIQAYEWIDVMTETTQIQEVYAWSELSLADRGGILVGHSPGRYVDAYGVVQNDKQNSLTTFYKLVLPQTEVTLTSEDLSRFPSEYGYQAGDTIGYGDYILRGSGTQIQVYLNFESQTITGDGLYVKPVSLTYPGQEYVFQDGDARPGEGTRRAPVGVQERVISQSVKVIKTVTGQVLENFRFKIYLKSNLEQLFRDQEGNVIWMDRKGKEIEPEHVKGFYPALVPKIYTMVTHKNTPLYKSPMDSVIANKNLYGTEKGVISGEQNSGYTAILEGNFGQYNYKKFFDAISVANGDKWKDASPSYTSFRPLGNRVNRIQAAEENMAVSDRVRQFAIDWYLDQEVEKLVKTGDMGKDNDDGANSKDMGLSLAYSDQLFDQALWEAVKKAENYLKPFFSYNLDDIYAIQWDSENNGGKDGDKTTVSADQKDEKWYFGISSVLPYGTYIIVEQQPLYSQLGDLKNRHYEIDAPKEICIPAIYESYEGAVTIPEEMSDYYTYHKELTPEELASRYQIRFNQEDHIIKAHNHYGDFEVYKYGMSMGKLANGKTQGGEGDYFALTQSTYKPLPNYYNEEDNRSAGKIPYYLTEGMSGREGVSSVYRYSSVAETGTGTVMAGAQKAYDGTYFQGLVPWSMAAPHRETEDMRPLPNGESSYYGFAYKNFVNEPYKSKLRIEKLDSETHENVLHDGAIFRIYKADNDESQYGTGEAKVYEEETFITGSRPFLEGMGASDIASVGAGELYRGLVPEGTPICSEENQVILTDSDGGKIGEFKAYTTTRDGIMDSIEGKGQIYGDQNAGYLETPQELDAGVYVLVEINPPAGYVRTKPVAVEIYSDQTAYYKNGNIKNKILATVYKRLRENVQKAAAPLDSAADLARLYIENAPIKLKVEKKKNSDNQVKYKVSGRVDGSLAEIGGNPGYEYAYSHGRYLGYGWRKGTLEYLKQQKAAGAQVELVYHEGIFAGYGYVTVDAKEKEENPYVAGAMMTLYEGLELKPSGDKEDHKFEGLIIERSITGSVTRMYVKEGYAGIHTEFLENSGTWDAATVNRSDTDILYYDLGDLDVFISKRVDGMTIKYGYDSNHSLLELKGLEEDRALITRTDKEHSIFAFKGGVPYLELTGGDFTEVSYKPEDKILIIPQGMTVYHIDRDGNRDAKVDPHTGMAYVESEKSGNVYVWPVTITKDRAGRKIGTDKITTSRVATLEEQNENGYLTGSWKSNEEKESHQMMTIKQNSRKENMDGEAVYHENNGIFQKLLRPVLDEHGLPQYFTYSRENYERETSLYDRDGDLVRRKRSDLLDDYQKASYLAESAGDKDSLNEKIYHRFGENYLIENTWISGDISPNDPFTNLMTEGQADILKRVPAGTYIMEELRAPDGYIKGFPTGMTVKETAGIQTVTMEDDHTKILIQKLDDTAGYEYEVLDMNLTDLSGNHPKTGALQEGKGSFSHSQMEGARLTLSKTGENSEVIGAWETGKEPIYLEGVAEGKYLLEESRTPEGFVTSVPVIVEVNSTGQVQIFEMLNDHTKVEFEKYTMDGENKVSVEGAGFTLYEAVIDEKGQAALAEGKPGFDRGKLVDTWKSSDGRVYRGFMDAFEEMYQEYGTLGRKITWNVDGTDYRAEYVSHEQIDASEAGGESTAFPTSADIRFRNDEGQEIRIVVYEQQEKGYGRDFIYEYQFDYRKLENLNDYAVSYITVDGMRRIDYLPVGKKYILVETEPPEGYGAAAERVITVEDTVQVQRYGILNQKSILLISKCGAENGNMQNAGGELPGAHMALYRGDENGELRKEPKFLIAEWISGSDGVYTEGDWINGRIPEGYKKGDRKPHALSLLPKGIYYLVELESPDYYTLMEPIKIEYEQNQQIQLVRAWNEPVCGELEVLKTDKEGELLRGAVFELTAYRGLEREPILKKIFSDQDGKAYISDLPAGEMKEDGEIVPYRYRLRELTPPKGYASDRQIHTFWFEPDQKGISWAWGQKAEMTMEIVNEKTRVIIRKQDFGSPKEWVAGAELAVYQVKGRDQQGNYTYDAAKPEASWVTAQEESHILEGLSAGETYILKEEYAPDGYELMEPYVFTLSEDGRGIRSVSGQMGIVTVHAYEESDTIHSVDIQGRYGVKVEMEMCNQVGDVIASWTAGGDGHVLREEDGIRDHEIYCFTETTIYSDGTREITGQTTLRCRMAEDGTWKIADRGVSKVHVSLAYEDGTEIASWNPSEIMSKMEIINPPIPESPQIIINNGEGAVKSSDLVRTSIECVNTNHTMADIVLTVKAEQGVSIIDPGEGKLENGQIEYVLEQMKPGEKRQVQYASQLSSDMKEVTVTVVSDCMGRKSEEKKKVPVLQKNQLTIFYEITGTGKEAERKNPHEFQVFLYTDKGEELKGSYRYGGSRNGTIVSGSIVRLSANEYITIDPGSIYRNIRYKVLDLTEDSSMGGQVAADTGACAFFTREVMDEKQTAIFQKGEQYQLLETTCYSDGSVRESHKMKFLLGDQVSIEGIAVLDRKQTVSISKREITGEEELEGALMQVQKEDGTVLEEWVSQKEPYLLKTVLVPGETYILYEKTAPSGYGYGESIPFRIEEGGYVNKVIMEDKKTCVLFSKKDITGQEELSGARLQILDEQGKVIEEWISHDMPYEITGKLEAGKTYRLHEEAAPDGYGYAADISFTVSMDGSIDLVEMKDAPTHVEVSKTDITGDKELPGAKMEILDEKGTVICQWTSTGEPYKLIGVLKAQGTYLLRETAAPDGYSYGADVKFSVSRDGSIDHVVMKDGITKVRILKTDQRTGNTLAGASLELLTLDGTLEEAWISTKEAYVIDGKLRAGQTYIIREKRAPSGYQMLRQDIRFTVPRDGKVITVEVENERKPSTPGIPEVPEKPEPPGGAEKTGKVYTNYESVMEAHGADSYQAFTNLGLPRTGDKAQENGILMWLARIGTLCFLVILWILRKKRAGKPFWSMMCLGMVFSMAAAVSVHAETVEVMPEGQLIVTGNVYREESELPEVLPEIYRYGDMEYIRQSYQVVTAMTEQAEKEVEEAVVYEEVEQTDILPETAEITVTDERYGTEYEQEFPVVNVQFYNWRWVPGFELSVTVEEADALTYDLNGVLVPAQEEAPFAGYENELLKSAHINPDYYRIREVRWTGDPWPGEDGKVYRNAVATGEKYVADCRAVYGGIASLDSVAGVAWQAVYEKQAEETETFLETEEDMDSWQLHMLETSPVLEEQQSEQNEFQIILKQIAFSVGIFLLLLPLSVICIRKYQKQQKRKSLKK